MIRTIRIPQRDFSQVRTQLNSVGWFLPPYVNVGFIEMSLRMQGVPGSGPFTLNDLEQMLDHLYGPAHLASMVLHRYPNVPIVSLYAGTISEATWAHFLGLHHIAVGGLTPVIEGIGRRLAAAQGHQFGPRARIKGVFEAIASHAKEDVIRRSIGATSEIREMLDSFSCFIESYFYTDTTRYPLADHTNRHGMLHGAYMDTEYGRPLNFFKTIAAVDFLTFLSSLMTSNMSGFSPDRTVESEALATRYVSAEGFCAMPDPKPEHNPVI